MPLAPSAPSPLRNLRWIIGGLLFLSTVVNYIDRQTLSVLGPFIKKEYAWSNADFAWLIIAFRVAYSIGQTVAGRFLDRVGTRAGLSIAVAFYSVAAMLTSFAAGLKSFCGFRFLLGLGEAGNWPGATKAVAEWFPRRESGWAVALFDSGSSVGAALAPWIVLNAYHLFGSWRPVFVVTGTLGLLWLVLFRMIYRRPAEHPRLSEAERAYILADQDKPERSAGNLPAHSVPERGQDARATQEASAVARDAAPAPLPYRRLLSLPQTWGIMISKALTDPVWFFITDWFGIYLASKKFNLEDSLLMFWIPFVASDLGNFAGGGLSSFWIRRGWSVGAARKAVVVVGGLGMTLLIPTAFLDSLGPIIACFAVSTFSYAAVSTMILNLPADIYPPQSVASVSGLSGTAAGICTIGVTFLIGRVADSKLSFAPILIGASLVPLLAVAAVLLLVRNNAATAAGEVRAL